MRTSFKVKSQGHQVDKCWDRKCVIHIFRKERPTNLLVHRWRNKTRRPITAWQEPCMTSKAPRPQVNVARSLDASDRCWPISGECKVPETPKLVGRLSTSRAIMHTSFQVKCQGHPADYTETESVTSPTNFKLGIGAWLVHALSTMGVDLWVDRGTCPPTFWSGGDAVFCPPYFFGNRHCYLKNSLF